MRNPHEEPKDLTSISLLQKDNPRLAEHLKMVARLGGTSYKVIKELKEQAEKAQPRRCGNSNMGRLSTRETHSGTLTLTERSRMVAELPPAIAEVYKSEASQGVTIPWHKDAKTGHHNLTQISQLRRDDAELYDIIEEAKQIEAGWAQDERDIAAAVAEEATPQESGGRATPSQVNLPLPATHNYLPAKGENHDTRESKDHGD